MRSRTAGVIIRPMQADDHDFVIGLAAQVFGPLSHDPVATMLSMLDEPDTTAAVAELGSDTVGFVVVAFERYPRDFGPWTEPLIARLNAIAVKPALFGRGIGRRLVAYAEDAAKRRGAVSLSLMTAQANARARALFTSAGFTAIAPLGRRYARGQRAIAMWKAIAADVATQ